LKTFHSNLEIGFIFTLTFDMVGFVYCLSLCYFQSSVVSDHIYCITTCYFEVMIKSPHCWYTTLHLLLITLNLYIKPVNTQKCSKLFHIRLYKYVTP